MSSDAMWQRAWAIFEEAITRPTPEREAVVAEACGNDLDLRVAVDELLAADATGVFFDRPLLGRPPNAENLSGPEAGHPERIGPYRLLRRVGQGGMSTVYLAVRADDEFRRRVVVKLVRRGMEDEATLRRLRTERQILAALDHPNVARLYDGGTTDGGLPYFVLEYVDGEPIDRYCRRERASVDEILTLFGKVCAAVQYAHQNLIVHRDIKPSNILVTADGEPKLLDFGIAKLLNPELVSAELEPTATWQRVLTPSYASPEQLRGGSVTTASDVYALGVLLYELLTGQLPFRLAGQSPAEIERLLTEQEPRKPSAAVTGPDDQEASQADSSPASAMVREGMQRATWARRLRGDLDSIVLKALRSVPRQRYGSAEALAADLERYRNGLPVLARQGSWRYRLGKALRRHRGAVVAAAGVLLLLVGFAGAMALQAKRLAAERDQAQNERDLKESMLTLVLDLFADADPFRGSGTATESVAEVVQRTAPRVLARLESQPAAQAQVQHAAGTVLARYGALPSARDLLTSAVERRRALLGPQHRDTAQSEAVLAAVLREEGDLAAAEALGRRAVETLRTDLGSNEQPALVTPLTELVKTLCAQDDLAQAEGPAREALALARASATIDPAYRIVASELLAKIIAARDEWVEATALYRHALAERRALYGEDHPLQQTTLHNLAFVLRQQGAYEAAEQTYLEAIALIRRTLGDPHPELASTFNNLGGVRFAAGAFAEAVEAYAEAQRQIRATFGQRHWRVFFVALRVERARAAAGDPTTAETTLRRLRTEWRVELADHWVLAEADGILGRVLLDAGRCDDARPLIESSDPIIAERGGTSSRRDAADRLRRLADSCA